MLSLLLALLVLATVMALVAWGGRAALVGLGAPPWFVQVMIAIFLIVVVLLVAQALGVVTPGLR